MEFSLATNEEFGCGLPRPLRLVVTPNGFADNDCAETDFRLVIIHPLSVIRVKNGDFYATVKLLREIYLVL